MNNTFLKQRFMRALYMGFLLDKDANKYLNSNHQLTYKRVEKYFNNYNKKLDIKDFKIKVDINYERSYCIYRTMGACIYLNNEDFRKILDKVDKVIWDSIKHSTESYTEESILVYDINLLEPLKRSGITTMGDKYDAYLNKQYTVDFVHLYSICSNL